MTALGSQYGIMEFGACTGVSVFFYMALYLNLLSGEFFGRLVNWQFRWLQVGELTGYLAG